MTSILDVTPLLPWSCSTGLFPTRLPPAINAVILCVAIFSDGSIVLPSLVPTYTAFTATERPLVDFFSSPGNSQNLAIAGSLVNFVVLTAVASGEAFEIVLVLIIPLLILGWFLPRKGIHVSAVAREVFIAPLRVISPLAIGSSAADQVLSPP